MLLLTKADMEAVFSMSDAIAAAKEVFRMCSDQACIMPLRVNIDVPAYSGQTLYMPAYIPDLEVGGVKIVSVFPENIDRGIPSVHATMILVDETTGATNCIMDGTYLTQLRTGAAQGAATDLLAREDAQVGLLLGAGGQAAKQLEAMLTARQLSEVHIFDLDQQRVQLFAAAMQTELGHFGARILAGANLDEILPSADVITAVTTSGTPVFDGRLVKPGVHVNGVGAYTAAMQELDHHLLLRADKIFVDSKEAALTEAGDLVIPIAAGQLTADIISGEFGDLVAQRMPGRQSADDITVFKSVGLAPQDVLTAYQIYEQARQHGVGTEFPL